MGKRSRNVMVELPSWWPPKVGDRLRSMRIGSEYLCHVVSVFRHDNKDHAVVGFYGKHKQWWHYDVIRGIEASLGSVKPA